MARVVRLEREAMFVEPQSKSESIARSRLPVPPPLVPETAIQISQRSGAALQILAKVGEQKN